MSSERLAINYPACCASFRQYVYKLGYVCSRAINLRAAYTFAGADGSDHNRNYPRADGGFIIDQSIAYGVACGNHNVFRDIS